MKNEKKEKNEEKESIYHGTILKLYMDKVKEVEEASKIFIGKDANNRNYDALLDSLLYQSRRMMYKCESIKDDKTSFLKSLAKYLISLLIIQSIIFLGWRGLELLIMKKTNPNSVDGIISIVLLFSLYLNLQTGLKFLDYRKAKKYYTNNDNDKNNN